jgi:2-oxo-4-hydroxy-4-carboxy--5-ureidoimidazoline (OHCU) decarboxylase
VHDLPRQLTVDALAALFEGRTRFVVRLAERLAAAGQPGGGADAPTRDVFAEARALLATLPEDEQLEALNAHPAIGAQRLSTTSAREQGTDADPAILAELARLNREYEATFGFRFVVFVNRRSKAEILDVLRRRVQRSRREELETALDELVAIAADRDLRAGGTG